ncbi:MAG: penicillin-binding protein 1C, partial [Proteobacteria bacterium]|nr:penicillin-binding protein 1C [Pseudomonadota bacterium]
MRRPLPPLLLCASLLTCCGAQATASALPTYQQVRQDFRPSDTLVQDRNGELLQRVRTDTSVRRGQWVALADISPALRQAMLLSEDKRFYEHSGVDWQAVSAAAWGNLWATRTRGASTITMQLAGLIDDDLRRRSSDGRSLQQKLGQAWAARELEANWRKDQILEAYLNTVPFRSEIVGIDALSRSLFGKAPHGLDARESALAAALVRAPNAKPALVAQRGCELLRTMQPGSRTDCLALEAFANASLARRDWPASDGIAPHLARRLVQQQMQPGTGELRTSLRAPLQRFALGTLQRHLRELRGRNVEDGAVVVLDNANGEVLAWVGSSGDTLSRAPEVDGVLAQRQPGSTLKPFLYAQAIAQRRLTAASLLDDSSAQINTAGGLYIPQNYDRHFKGLVSVRSALAASLNVPAVRTLVMVGPEAFARQLRASGIQLRENGDYYGYSLALGSSEVSLLQLTNAYRTLANGGRFSEAGNGLPRTAAPAFTPATDAGASFIVGDILHDANARAPTFGLDSVLATRFWTAVKTGTSKDMRDNWAVGWSSRYTVGVWVGNASGAPMWDVSGSSGAAPVWAQLMAYLHRREPSRAPQAPAGLLQTRVSFGDGLEAAREEWFIAGTEQRLFAPDGGSAMRSGTARISAPADGTIVALDPDIPPQRQRVVFEAEGGASGQQLQWRIDGRAAGQGPRLPWLPWPGRHVVQLVDARQ